MFEYIIFDLDGTLHKFDSDTFTKAFINKAREYFKNIDKSLEKIVIDTMHGTNLMMHNNGNKTNGEIFFNYLKDNNKDLEKFGDIGKLYEMFYEKYFDDFKDTSTKIDGVNELILKLKNKGYKLVIASNPVFPSFVHKYRIKWAGLDPDDFIYYTGAENSSFCKPHVGYYNEILNKLHTTADKCLMVGNDVIEDMEARNAGIDTFLVTYDIVNTKNKDINEFKHGNYDMLYEYIINCK